jgi:hypothetical protein
MVQGAVPGVAPEAAVPPVIGSYHRRYIGVRTTQVVETVNIVLNLRFWPRCVECNWLCKVQYQQTVCTQWWHLRRPQEHPKVPVLSVVLGVPVPPTLVVRQYMKHRQWYVPRPVQKRKCHRTRYWPSHSIQDHQ